MGCEKVCQADEFLARSKKWINYYVDLRLKSTTLGEEYMYVNITGGEKDGKEIKLAAAWLARWGFSKYGNQTMGPLLRATQVWATST